MLCYHVRRSANPHEKRGTVMCKFCEQKHQKMEADRAEDGAEISIIRDDDLGPCLYVEAFCQCGYDGGDGWFRIDYCPMCGRKL